MNKYRNLQGYWNQKCEVCGAEFYAQRKSGVYCSNACKQISYRKNKEKKEEAKKQQMSLF